MTKIKASVSGKNGELCETNGAKERGSTMAATMVSSPAPGGDRQREEGDDDLLGSVGFLGFCF